MDIPAFATAHLALLALERAADTTQQSTLTSTLPPSTLVRYGLALTNLTPTSQRTGFNGRTLLTLSADTSITGTLPAHGLRPGDPVRVAPQPPGSATKTQKAALDAAAVGGVVSRVEGGAVTVAVGDEDVAAGVDALAGRRLWVVKVPSEVVWNRMEGAMRALRDLGEGGGGGVVEVLFGRAPRMGVGGVGGVERWFDTGLNEGQKEAVRFALGAEEVALIHGPPGTGKTQTLLELILQLTTATPPQRILVCGPSNISIDNIALRLPASLALTRLGHPARLLPRVLARSLDAQSRTSDAAAIAADVRTELDALLARLNSQERKTRLKGRARHEAWGTVRELREEYRRRERRCVEEVLARSTVVLATLHGAGGRQIRGMQFDVLIVDEASQALEAQCWGAILRAGGVGVVRKVVLAGDHMQLPPTIKSSRNTQTSVPPPDPGSVSSSSSSSASLETTLFSRLISLHGDTIKRTLTTQYRMHTTIMAFPSTELYHSLLTAHPSVAAHTLPTLPYPVAATEDTTPPLLFIDTQGGDFPEDSSPLSSSSSSSSTRTHARTAPPSFSSESRSNTLEARLVAQHVRSLLSAGVRGGDIGVLAPYSAQVSLLSRLLRAEVQEGGVEVNTVDGFQGREKEVVVLSMVRSNDVREVGFVGDVRRVNVAVTRARRQLCVVADGETVGGRGGFLGRWVRALEEEGVVRYPDVGEVLGWEDEDGDGGVDGE